VNDNTVKKYALEAKGFGDNKATSLYEDKEGTIWCGSNGSGLFYFDTKKQSFVSLAEENNPIYISKTSYVSSILQDYDGDLWIGTMYGLYKLTKNKNGSFDYQLYRQDLATNRNRINSNSVQTMYEDIHKNLWIGTIDNGLNVKAYQTDDFKSYQIKDGLTSNNVRSIVMDAYDNVWVGGNRGLSKIDPRTNFVTNYGIPDGLSSNNFYAGSIITSKGKLFFGTNNGFN